MLVEPIESRQLFAATSLDPRFGDGDGKVELPSRDVVLSLAGAKSAVYAVVADSSSKQQYLFKYDNAGHVDTTFGTHGHQALAFRAPLSALTDPTLIAVDHRTRDVYVGFASSKLTDTVARATLQIERFTAGGQVDTQFGTGGVYAYTDQVPFRTDTASGVGAGTDLSFSLNRLQPLTHRQLLVEMDTSQAVTGGDLSTQKTTGFTDVQLQRLKANGRRDADFGRRGVVVAETGYTTETSNDGGHSKSDGAPKFADLQLLDSGRYRVIDFAQGSTYLDVYGMTEDSFTTDENRYVHSLVLNADGSMYRANGSGEDDASVFSTAISRLKVSNVADYKRFVPVQATADGPVEVQVIGTYGDSESLSAGPGPVGALRITVDRGIRSAPAALDLPAKARFVSVTRAPDDSRTFVTTTAGTTAFLRDLTLNTVWGDDGTTGGSYNAYYPDDSGGLLVTFPGGFGRVDGLWAKFG